jgi:hypothetical protein
MSDDITPISGDIKKPVNIDDSQATTIFVLGLMSLLACQVLGPFAWYLGRQYLEGCREAGVEPHSQAVAGHIMGIIGTVFLAIIAAFILLYVAFFLCYLLFIFGYMALLFCFMGAAIIGGA